jgi:hypothetical protein
MSPGAVGHALPAAARWVYLASDPDRAGLWETALQPRASRIPIALRLDEAAGALREPFCRWVDDLSRRYGADRHWWFTAVSERNTLISPFFLSICHLQVAKQLLQKDPPDLIVAGSWGLVIALRRLAAANGVDARVRGRRYGWGETATSGVRGIGTAAYFLVSAVTAHIAARRSRAGRGPKGFESPPRRRVLARTFFHETHLASDGVFRDRYYPGLLEWLSGQDADLWVLPSVAERQRPLVEKYRWMRSSRTQFVIPEDWLRASDYVDALRFSLKSRRWPDRTPMLAGLDVSALAAAERRRQASGNRYRQACVVSRLPRRLAAAGFEPNLVIDWYENQVTDKGLVLGCRDAFPDAAIKAVQNTCLFENLLHSFPTPVEREQGTLADQIICNGPLAAGLLARSCGDDTATLVGCSFRYRYLWERVAPKQRSPGGLEVLVALPIFTSETAELIALIRDVCLDRADTAWYVKPHPDVPITAVQRALGPDVAARVTVVEGSVPDWLDRVDVVITGGTGVAVEAAACGIPVVLNRSRISLNYDPLVWFPGLATSCASSGELRAALDRISRLGHDDRAELFRRGREVLRAVFAPVTDDALRQHVA